MDAAPGDTAEQIAAKQAQHHRLTADGRAAKSKLLADAWCAAFVAPKTAQAPAITEGVLQSLKSAAPEHVRGSVDAVLSGATIANGVVADSHEAVAAILRLSDEFQFTHLQIAFPEVFEVPDDPDGAGNERTGWSGGFDAVIGNPPFLNRLRDLTSTRGRVASLQSARYGGAAEGYADAAYAFFALACDAVRPDCGRVGLVQPESLLAADGAATLRRDLATRFTVESLWVAGEKVFSASVLTCAVTVRSGRHRRPTVIRRAVGGAFDTLPDMEVTMAELARMPTWGSLIADGFGVPRVSLNTAARLGDVATATADFRDQYYGLQPFVTEAEDRACDRGQLAPLITAGLIDPLRNLWGTTPTRFTKRKWNAPAVDIARLRSGSDLSEWADRRLVPIASRRAANSSHPPAKGALTPEPAPS